MFIIKSLHLISVHFLDISAQCKQIIIKEHNNFKNSNCEETDQLAIQSAKKINSGLPNTDLSNCREEDFKTRKNGSKACNMKDSLTEMTDMDTYHNKLKKS